MKGADPLLLGQIAIHEGLVTPDQLAECLKIQESSDPPRRLGQILIDKGYLARERLESLMAIQRLRVDTIAADPDRGGLFGQIALRLGHITQLQLDECLREQQQLSRHGSPVLLGQIFLRKNFITTDQFLEILRRQKKEVVKCGGCDTLYDTREHLEGAKFVCSRCGTVVQIPYRQTEAGGAGQETRAPGQAPGAPEIKGQTVGRYQILETLGQGGMGVVYKAYHRDLNRAFALKVLKTGDLTTFDAVRRFQREARLAARLKHPHIVSVHDAGEESGIHYIAMEYIDGEPLSVRLVSRRGRARDSLILMEKVVRAVAYAHSEGVIHRDLKPANIMVDRQGEPHIMDFGLAKQVFEGSLLTRSGAFLGTPFYMAPEQIRGEVVDARSDLYTLGVILYEILAGRLPFTGTNSAEAFHKIASEDAVPLRALNSRVHPDLETVCMKAIEKDRERRYPTADAFAEDLRRHLDGEPIQARPVGPLGRLARRFRKNPALSFAAVATFLLAVAAVVLGFIAFRANREFQARMAEARRQKAERRFDLVKSEADQALILRPNDKEARALLEEARSQLDEQRARLDAELEARPRIDEAERMILSLEKQMAARRLKAREIADLCDQAERKLNEALAVSRGDERALTWMARARALRGDAEGALRHLDDAAAREYLKAFFERGRLLVRKYRRPRGLPQLLAREDRPLFTDPSPDSPQAELYRQMARADLRRVRSQARERGMLLYAEAALDFLDLRFAEAERKIGAYLRDFAADADALALRALSVLYQERPDRALPDLDQALEYLPADGFLADWRAIVKYLVGDAAGALRDLSREGPDAGTLCLRGTLLYVRSEFEAAHADYRRAAETAPLWADAYAGRAAAAAALGRLDEADADWSRAIELEPREAALHENRGLLRLRSGRKKEAEADLLRAIELSPSRRERLGPSLDACRG